MAYINIKKNLPSIGPLLRSNVEKESIKITKTINKLDANIEKNAHEYIKHVHMINEANLNSTEEENFRIPKRSLADEKTLIVFMWDMFSPFLGDKIDKYSSKLSYLKSICDIKNSESWEVNRIDDCFTPWEKYIPPRVNSEEKKRDIGKYYHITERKGCHIGFLISMAQSALPVENNNIFQSRLENTFSPSETKNKEKPFIADHMLKDTTCKRLDALEKSLKSFTLQLMAYFVEKKVAYNNIFIFINPICSISNPDVPLMSKLVYTYFGNMLLKGLQRYMTPHVEIITVKDLCFIDINTYNPGKRVAKDMKALVRYNHLSH